VHADHFAFFAVRHLQGRVAHFACLLAEDRPQEPLLRSQLGLTFGSDLADQNVSGTHVCSKTHDPPLVEVDEDLLGDVGDVTGDLLGTELGIAGIDLVLLDVDRRQQVVLDKTLGHDDCVLEVVALEAHESDHQVRSQRKLPVVGRGTVREHLAFDDLGALLDYRTLVHAGGLIRAPELVELVGVVLLAVPDDDSLGRDFLDDSVLLGDDHVPGVDRGPVLETRSHNGCHRLDQGHSLPLHVGPHQSAVGVVVLEERNASCRHGHDLLGRDVDIVDFCRGDVIDLVVARPN